MLLSLQKNDRCAECKDQRLQVYCRNRLETRQHERHHWRERLRQIKSRRHISLFAKRALKKFAAYRRQRARSVFAPRKESYVLVDVAFCRWLKRLWLHTKAIV